MPNPVVHFEIGSRDSEKASAFYRDLFGWKLESHGVTHMVAPEEGGIPGHITTFEEEPRSYITFYVAVDDLQSTLVRAEALGGKTVIPPTEIPGGMGSFAWFSDIEGTIVGIWKGAEQI